jgi:hypothetical protein
MRSTYNPTHPLDQDCSLPGDESRTEGTLLDFLGLPPPRALQPLEPPPARPGRFRFVGKIRFETDGALCVCPRDYIIVGPACFWLPRSQVRIVHWGDHFHTFEIPEWLARERGFFDATTVKER